MSIGRGLGIALLVAGLAVPVLAKDGPEALAADFDAAFALARRHIAAEPGASYDEKEAGPWFHRTHSRSIQLCFDSLAEPDVSPFTLVLALDEKGGVSRAYLDADTNVSLCLRAAVSSSTFPAPPFAPFYQPVILNFAP